MAVEPPADLLNYLPAIYESDPFLGQFLQAFEDILLKSGNAANPGLEEEISTISRLFDPLQTPEDFLSWLASWTAFTLRADLNIDQQRNFIANIIPLYRSRGTKEYLQKLLQIFTIGLPTIDEFQTEFQIGVQSTVGKDTYVGGGPPHFFRVTVAFSRLEASFQQRQIDIAAALIELAKPAHTYYEFDPIFPSMQIGVYSTVGVDTLLGTAPANQS